MGAIPPLSPHPFMACTRKNLPTVTSVLVEMVLRSSSVLSYFLNNKLVAHIVCLWGLNIQHKRIYTLKHTLIIKMKYKVNITCNVIYLFITARWREMTSNSCQAE